MKTLILLFFSIQLLGQQVATIKLADGTFINNAPSGRSWIDYEVKGFSLQEVTDTILIDDSEQNRITYYGNWRISDTLAIPQEEGNCYCSWARTPNDSMVFKFTNATWFGWYGEQMEHHGVVEVWWQNRFAGTVDTYAANNERLTLNWWLGGLDTAQVYTFKLIPTGTKNSASSGAYIVNQYIKLIKNIPVEPPTGPIDTIPPPIIPPDTVWIPSPPDTITIVEKEVLTITKILLLKPKFEYDTLVGSIDTLKIIIE